MEVYMLNKPAGYLTAVRDRSRPTVMELLPPELRRLHPIGRLDLDTEGLLLLTDEGRLDPLLLRPEAQVEKLYFFRAFGRLEQEAFDRMAAGVELEGTGVRSLPARAWPEGYSSIGACEALLPPKKHNHLMKNPGRPVTAGWIALREGRKHQVKLMVKAVGGHVFTLKRVSIGPLVLDPELPPGGFRPLNAAEIVLLPRVE
ncbi:MAG: pseudouridine synthase [Oscillospiraceae bacterium]|nr:pseudouridine synthase [Oscillospiraceae bacterium]